MPFKMRKILLFFQKNKIYVSYPNQNFQTCYRKRTYFLIGLIYMIHVLKGSMYFLYSHV